MFNPTTAIRLLLLLLTATLVQASSADAPDAQALISRLARPAPASVDFTEIRFSPLLRTPVIVSGTLGYEGADTLDRHVVTPYREDTQIRGNAVKVRREGEPERSFALKRAPELQGLLSAFAAMLGGDHAAVERTFEIATSGTDDAWSIELTPRDARLAKRVQTIRIDGRQGQPDCFWILNDNQSASAMLLGETAHMELMQPLTREWLERKCR
ncbi:MAG TPA: LolA-related protein [Povalibacter sp.]|jgi:hypothetical protein|nr:LolA-related protein [Povalibacter sp.]